MKDLDSGAKVDGGDCFYIASGGSGSSEYPEGDVRLYRVAGSVTVKYSDLEIHPAGHIARIKEGANIFEGAHT